jgi:hypothetical protein
LGKPWTVYPFSHPVERELLATRTIPRRKMGLPQSTRRKRVRTENVMCYGDGLRWPLLLSQPDLYTLAKSEQEKYIIALPKVQDGRLESLDSRVRTPHRREKV